MPVKDDCRPEPRTVASGESIQDAATRTDTCAVGSLVVVDGQERPVGVAIRFLRQYSPRRLPVVAHATGKLEGIPTADGIVQLLASELSGAAELIRSQFPGEPGGAQAPSSGATQK